MERKPASGAGIGGGMILSLYGAYKNIDTRTGQPLWNPDKGDDYIDWLAALVERLTPIPPSFVKTIRNVRASVQETSIDRYEETVPTLPGAVGQAVSPFRVKTPEALESAGLASRRGQAGEMIRRKRGISRDPRLTDKQKGGRRERIDKRIEDLRERRR